MALEDEVKNLTKAIEALTLQLKDNYTVDTPKDTPEKKPDAKKPAKNVEASAPASDTKAADSVAPEEAPRVTLDSLAKEFTALVAKDINVAKEILKKYNAAKLSLVDPKQFDSLHVDIQEALNG